MSNKLVDEKLNLRDECNTINMANCDTILAEYVLKNENSGEILITSCCNRNVDPDDALQLASKSTESDFLIDKNEVSDINILTKSPIIRNKTVNNFERKESEQFIAFHENNYDTDSRNCKASNFTKQYRIGLSLSPKSTVLSSSFAGHETIEDQKSNFSNSNYTYVTQQDTICHPFQKEHKEIQPKIEQVKHIQAQLESSTEYITDEFDDLKVMVVY
ncbi:uncharacterized protein LOC119680169 [Teleopsis dalmanni]|uniref:uncharacterized protein LOC119680169 n=1 Tax=Teleopsis dalmanni TaxID=139649 RepID=UPI0018CC8163|nr:uncharacterized protein LOC119680169 [Teleopsis dalmanni]XP_037948789.1 uncharacterized protein LOC119680169 [Teleopsis dalmanni]